ncbi:MAG: hypothetical protein K6C40_11285 [Thermoguttaceae bacterium]|nr:hypothetical protein [Thermoguttaceae bacterium]
MDGDPNADKPEETAQNWFLNRELFQNFRSVFAHLQELVPPEFPRENLGRVVELLARENETFTPDERAVLNDFFLNVTVEFLKRTFPGFSVEKSLQIPWIFHDGKNDSLSALEAGFCFKKGAFSAARLLVDVRIADPGNHQNNIYQLFAKVKNEDRDEEGRISGLLLYFSLNGEKAVTDSTCQYSGNWIETRTIDLTQSWEEIQSQITACFQPWPKHRHFAVRRRNLGPRDRYFLEYCLRKINTHWKWARTMPTVPHEYIVRKNGGFLSDEEFCRFVQIQRSCGTFESWGDYHFPYLYFEGYKYWTMGWPIHHTSILNRQKIFTEYDALADDYDARTQADPNFTLSETLKVEMAEMLSSGTVLDLGAGTGRLLREFAIEPDRYVGLEPASKMNERFDAEFPAYSSRLIRGPFEEVNWKKEETNEGLPLRFDLTVGLWGSPSYIMRPYLFTIPRISKRFFLMFYAPDYEPDFYGSVPQTFHPFHYAISTLRSIFPSDSVVQEGNWLMVRS